jgi:predicted DNA binding CopG/RHH family protein
MKNTRKHYSEQDWEQGEIGQSEAFVKKTSLEKEKAIEEGLDLQMISIRLQKDLIDELKHLAHKAGIGYQPYIRQLLTQHVVSKRKRNGTYG